MTSFCSQFSIPTMCLLWLKHQFFRYDLNTGFSYRLNEFSFMKWDFNSCTFSLTFFRVKSYYLQFLEMIFRQSNRIGKIRRDEKKCVCLEIDERSKLKRKENNKPCLTTIPVGTWTMGKLLLVGLTGRLAGVPGGGEVLALPTEPGSLNPCVLFSSGPSKKLRLNSLPASKDTSGVRVSGAGALPRPAVRDWSILKTSIVRRVWRTRPPPAHHSPRANQTTETKRLVWFIRN